MRPATPEGLSPPRGPVPRFLASYHVLAATPRSTRSPLSPLRGVQGLCRLLRALACLPLSPPSRLDSDKIKRSSTCLFTLPLGHLRLHLSRTGNYCPPIRPASTISDIGFKGRSAYKSLGSSEIKCTREGPRLAPPLSGPGGKRSLLSLNVMAHLAKPNPVAGLPAKHQEIPQFSMDWILYKE